MACGSFFSVLEAYLRARQCAESNRERRGDPRLIRGSCLARFVAIVRHRRGETSHSSPITAPVAVHAGGAVFGRAGLSFSGTVSFVFAEHCASAVSTPPRFFDHCQKHLE
jgi:hypothetical protein